MAALLPDKHAKRGTSWWQHRPFLLELFVLANVAFLTLDVYMAHAVNDFAHWGEWIPVFFAAAAPFLLGAGLLVGLRSRKKATYWTGAVVGWGCILVGVLGLIWHLESRFFQQMTLRGLVYSAPFVAPLAFTGLGFLLLMNRQVPHDKLEWGKWVLFLAWGGFVGNFILSLMDHAQNGFFFWTEWIPVVTSALAVGYLFTTLVRPMDRQFALFGYGVLALQVVTGMLGFVLHAVADWRGPAEALWDNLIFGAPVFAPLLFADLALLAALGLWDVRTKVKRSASVSA